MKSFFLHLLNFSFSNLIYILNRLCFINWNLKCIIFFNISIMWSLNRFILIYSKKNRTIVLLLLNLLLYLLCLLFSLIFFILIIWFNLYISLGNFTFLILILFYFWNILINQIFIWVWFNEIRFGLSNSLILIHVSLLLFIILFNNLFILRPLLKSLEVICIFLHFKSNLSSW